MWSTPWTLQSCMHSNRTAELFQSVRISALKFGNNTDRKLVISNVVITCRCQLYKWVNFLGNWMPQLEGKRQATFKWCEKQVCWTWRRSGYVQWTRRSSTPSGGTAFWYVQRSRYQLLDWITPEMVDLECNCYQRWVNSWAPWIF